MILAVPIVVNTIMIIHLPKKLSVGDASAWIGFFGNYSGGILGGLVAFGVAKYQIEHQEKINQKDKDDLLERENDIRRYNQMPSLIKIKFLLEQIKENLKTANALAKNQIKIPINETNSFTLEMDKTPLKLIPVNKEYISAIDGILSVDLQTNLIKLTNFYIEFDRVAEINIQKIQFEFDKNNNKLKQLSAKKKPSKKEQSEINEIAIKNEDLLMEIQVGVSNKKIMWNKLLNENYFEIVDTILLEINKEIEAIKKLNI